MRSYKHVCDYLPFETVYTAKIIDQSFFLFYFFKIIHQKSNITKFYIIFFEWMHNIDFYKIWIMLIGVFNNLKSLDLFFILDFI